jgi:hypothetical protein
MHDLRRSVAEGIVPRAPCLNGELTHRATPITASLRAREIDRVSVARGGRGCAPGSPAALLARIPSRSASTAEHARTADDHPAEVESRAV